MNAFQVYLVVFVGLVAPAQSARPLQVHKAFLQATPQQHKVVGFVAVKQPTPMFTEETMPAVSPTLQCVMNLSLQYFLIYTMLAIVRTVNNFTAQGYIGIQNILNTAATTVTYAPMLSVLFLGVRMRAIQLSQGETEKYKLPQPWVQQSMYVCTYAVLGQVLLVFAMACITGEQAVKTDEDGNLDTSGMETGGLVGTVVSVVRYLIMLALYGGFAVVCAGAFMMEGPKEIWGEEGAPPVSPAVACTMNLTTQFFAVYLMIAVTKTAMELGGTSDFLTKLNGLLTLAKYTVGFAPMLCILFVGARMRALQMDPKHGNPQPWAQNCFYACAYSVLLQTLLVIIMPFCVKCNCKQGASEGDVVFEMENHTLFTIMTAVRWIALIALYGGFSAVIVSVFIIEHPQDVSLTPPISPAMQCVMNLTVQYFFIYLVLFLCITAKQFTESDVLTQCIWIFEGAQKTVMFAPMLSMLFIGARMRALQLTKAADGTIPPTAGPQRWAQDGMFLSTWSVLIQLIMTILVPMFTGGGKPELDEDGNVKMPQGTGKIFGIIADTVRYICLISMYGGVTLVMYAVFTMTPETLPPYAEPAPLIPGAPVPNPPTPPTPSF